MLRLGAESFHATSYLKQSQTNTDKFIDKGTIFIVTLGTPQFLIGQHVVGKGEDVDPLHVHWHHNILEIINLSV